MPMSRRRRSCAWYSIPSTSKERCAARFVIWSSRTLSCRSVPIPVRIVGISNGVRRRATPSTRSSVIRCTPARTPLESVKSILGRKNPEKRGSGRVVMEPKDYHALIPDHCPAYITMERYERNQRRLAENRARAESKGAPREGSSLLGGLIFCGRCGRRMSIHYSGQYGNSALRLSECSNRTVRHPQCQSLAGKPLDDLVAAQVLTGAGTGFAGIKPAAAGELQKERERLDRNWKQRVGALAMTRRERNGNTESSNPKIDLSPANWTAAGKQNSRLSKTWNKSMRFRQTHPPTLSTEEREAIRSLSKNLPALWHASTTTSTDRQAHRAFVARTSRRQRARGIRVRPCYVAVGRRFHHTARIHPTCSSLRSNRGLCPDG